MYALSQPSPVYYMFSYFLVCLLFVSLLFSLHFLWLGVDLRRECLSSYECGFEPAGVSHCVFCMKFFLIAIIFIVFDVEVAFIIPGLSSSTLVFSFVIILLLGLVYEFAYGGLDWVA